jgi:polysaccharide pyruvyl transferase WcaK-like protein
MARDRTSERDPTPDPDPATGSGVYLYGYYGQGNVGDDLLMEAAIGMIRSIRPQATVHVHCHDPARLPAIDGAGLLIPVPANRILADQTLAKPKRFAAYAATVDAAFRRCDTLVFGGGTVFQDKASAASMLVIMATVLLARRRGLRIVMLGSGVADFTTAAGRFAMARILGATDAACVRDEASLAICRAIRRAAPLRLTGDLVYSLGQGLASTARPGPPHVLLSIQPAVTDRDTPASGNARAALCAVIADTLSRGGSCSLLALEIKSPGEPGMDDMAAWARTAAGYLAEAPDRVRLLPLSGSMTRVMSLMAGASAHVGMRYHGHVLAALGGIPFAGLAHDPKIREVCRVFGMPCLEAGTADAQAFAAAARQAQALVVASAPLAGVRQDAARNLDALRDVMAAA